VLIKAKDKSRKTVMMLFDPGNLVAMQVADAGARDNRQRFVRATQEAK
jgi:hypothetical protein